MEDRDVSEELSALTGNPNANQALLRISGLSDWSPVDIEVVDRRSEVLKIGLDKLFDYVMENYCSFAQDTLEWKYISMSLMLSLTLGEIRLYNLHRDFCNEIKFLSNVYIRLMKSNVKGTVVVTSRF